MGKSTQIQRRIVLAFHALIVVMAFFWFQSFALPTTSCHLADQASAAAICASAQRQHTIGLIAGGLLVLTSLVAWLGVWRQQRWVPICDWVLIGLLSWIIMTYVIGGLRDPILLAFLLPIGILVYLSSTYRKLLWDKANKFSK